MKNALTAAAGASTKNKHKNLRSAVHRHRPLTRKGLLERTFAFGFRGMVYPPIWEDPAVDLEALRLGPDTHVVTIASDGCNVLSYLTANPKRVTAVDLNSAHIALNRLKLCAARHLSDRVSFYHFFGEANRPDNIAAYNRFVRPNLDAISRKHWEPRDLLGRRRIGRFARNFYQRGLLGRFIGAAHLLARLYGLDPRGVLAASSITEQRTSFESCIAPIFEKRFVRWLTRHRIPPAQYEALAGADRADMAKVLHARLERLACDFDLKQNYFAWQAFVVVTVPRRMRRFLRIWSRNITRRLLPWVDRVDVRHANFTEFLAKDRSG